MAQASRKFSDSCFLSTKGQGQTSLCPSYSKKEVPRQAICRGFRSVPHCHGASSPGTPRLCL